MNYLKSALLLITLLLIGPVANAETFEVTMAPGAIHNMAAFKLWVNPEVKKIRGILILNPGSNGDGRNNVEDEYWQAFANKHDFALMGTYLTDHRHPNMMIEEYIRVSQGSGQAMLDAIDHFATESGHAELSHAPFLLWGHSAGGELNYEIAAWIPERVIAFVVNHGGYYYSSIPPEATRQTPGLFFVGLDDLPSRNAIIKGIFLTNRRAGALWALAEEKGVGHEVVGSRDLAVEFYEAVMKKRLPENAMGYESLRPLTEDTGTLASIYTHAITQLSADVKREETSWMVSAELASSWQVFVTKERD